MAQEVESDRDALGRDEVIKLSQLLYDHKECHFALKGRSRGKICLFILIRAREQRPAAISSLNRTLPVCETCADVVVAELK